MHASESQLILTHAIERDVDLILVEEFKCNPSFTDLFVSKIEEMISKKILFTTSSVIHSKRRTYNRREIDICLELKQQNEKRYILIENKLDALEQINQAESYEQECDLLIQEEKAIAAYPVLVCPNTYRINNQAFANKFATVITYEMLVDMLQTSANQSGIPELASRLCYRADLIRQAIDKKRRGYTPIVRPEIGEFNQLYVDFCKKRFPKLIPGPSMLKAGNPSESKTMIFSPACLPRASYLPQTRLVHQLREGNTNINFYSWGNHFEKVAPTIKEDLAGTGFKVGATVNRRKGGNSGLMIYTETPAIDNFRSFAGQENAILNGIERAEALRSWFESNQPMIQRWASIVNMG